MFNKPPQTIQDQFQTVFGVPYDRFHNDTGFDVIAFDDWLDAGEEAVKDVIEKRYGYKGVDVITEIMAAEVAQMG